MLITIWLIYSFLWATTLTTHPTLDASGSLTSSNPPNQLHLPAACSPNKQEIADYARASAIGGSAGLPQSFGNNDLTTLNYLTQQQQFTRKSRQNLDGKRSTQGTRF